MCVFAIQATYLPACLPACLPAWRKDQESRAHTQGEAGGSSEETHGLSLQEGRLLRVDRRGLGLP